MTRALTTTVPAIIPATVTAANLAARDRCLPVDDVFASMLPDAGLQRGWVVGCSGPAAMSLGLALARKSVASGAWLAAVAVPMLGLEAVAEHGVPLARVVLVDVDAGPRAEHVWAERVAIAADGFDLIVTCPPRGADRVVRRVRQRLQARGAVLLAVGAAGSVACDVELSSSAVAWVGLGQGHGRLHGRRVTVRAAGRRVPRPVARELWLPGPTGAVEPIGEPRSVVASGTLERAG